MSDAVDRAQAIEEQMRADAIARCARVVMPAQFVDVCVQCNGVINPKRSTLGYSTCIECAQSIEANGKR